MMQKITHPSSIHDGRFKGGFKWYLAALMLMFGFIEPAAAQQWTIGTGTSSNSSTGYPTPFGNYWSGMKTQFLYTAAELTAAGATPGNIHQLSFNVSGLNTAGAHLAYNINMKGTTTTALSTWETGTVNYFSAPSVTPVLGWNDFPLATPFNWNGTDNVLVEICFWNGPSTYTSNASVYYSAVTGGAIDFHSDSGGPFCTQSPAVTTYANRPNIRFTRFNPCTGTPSISVSPAGPIASCAGATQILTAVVPVATSGFTYQWDSASTCAGTWGAISGATSNTYSFSVTGNKFYRVRVTCSNAGGGTATSACVQVTAAPPTYSTIPYFQDFEAWQNYCSTSDVPSNNWTNQPSTGNTSWRRNDQGSTASWYSTSGMYAPTAAKSGTYSARFHSYGASFGTPSVTTPGNLDLYLDCSASTAPKNLYFWYNNFAQYGYDNDSLSILLSTNGGISFTTLAAFDTSSAWVRKQIPIASSSAQTIVRFQGRKITNYDYSDILVDSVYVATPCSGQPSAGILTPGGPITGCPGSLYTFTSQGTTLAGNLSYTWIQKANGATTWSTAVGTVGNNGGTFTTPNLYDTISYRMVVKCLGSSLTDTTPVVTINILRPTYASVPFVEDFESWSNRCYTTDIPGTMWSNYPATGDNSWRRDDQGASASWTSATTGLSTPVSAVGAHSARFHGYYAPTGAAGAGLLDLFVNCSTVTGNKELQFYLKTQTGTTYPNDSVIVMMSTNGGSTYTTLGAYGPGSGSWDFNTLTVPSNSATTVIRFKARSDYQYYGDIAIDYVRVLPPCAATPSAGNVTPITPCANADFQLTLQNNSQAAGITYQWQDSTAGSPGWSASGITNAATMIATGNISMATYFRCIITCTNSSASDTTPAYLVNLAPFYNCYCNSTALYNSATDNIGRVTLRRTSTGDTLMNNGPGLPLYNFTPIAMYSNFRQTVPAPKIVRDSTYTISIQQVESSTSVYTTRAYVFVDFNRDGVFQSTELMYVGAPVSGSNPVLMVAGQFTVPDSAKIGLTGMRIILDETSAATMNPCGNYSYGETEDYLAEIAYPPCDGPTNPGVAHTSDTSMCAGYTFQLVDTTHEYHRSGISWLWQVSTNNGSTWSAIPNSAGRDTVNVLFTQPSSYRLQMTCNITNDITYSNVLFVNGKPPYKCYCYSIANGGAADTSDIGAFSIGNFVINTGGPHLRNPIANKGRTDYTDLGPIELYADSTYTMNIYHTMKSQTHADARITMFLDYNNNLAYDIPSERVNLTNNISTAGGWYVINTITIPSAVIPNVPTGMRIILNNNIGPNVPSDEACGPYTSGETEDYTVIFRQANPTGIGTLNNVQDLSLYPNPTGGRFTVSFNAETAVKDMEINVTTVTGQSVLRQNFNNVGHTFVKDFDLTEQARGVYFVEIRADGQKAIRKVVLR
ncbi:GEVED domain-containing protein [Taibaiella soli]|uniref:MAM domain-containing protein n=1 Tax=Taibaiella soli TaxID=1649169 RepID=A0A2W2AYR9_9BACT|nr:GEVED domain-containing protein [Taibaiella soli]PZF73154.1 hypothetical protein DN068_09795 [Taibaiella soli]